MPSPRQSRSPRVFFIDTNGALCARPSGHALDVEGQRFTSPWHLFPVLSTHHSEPSQPLQAGALSSDIAGPSRSPTQTHIPTLSHSPATTARPAISPSNSSTSPRLLVAPPAHAPRRGDRRADLCVPRSVVLSRRPIPSGDEHRELSDKAWVRRQWEVLPLRTTAARRNSRLLFYVFERCLWSRALHLYF
jgi:hypothetical protein